MTKHISTLIAVVATATLVLAVACGPQTGDVCQSAAQHVASCTGSMPDMEGVTCDATQASAAEGVLNKTCSEIRSNPAGASGKADFWTGDGSIAKAACLLMIGARGGSSGAICCYDANCQGNNICRDYRCRAPSTEGGVCKRRGHCESGLRCIAKKCAPARELGQSCPTGTGDCKSGLVCLQGTCSEPLSEGAVCTDNGDCGYPNTCIGGVCKARAKLGGQCDQGDRADCDSFLTCVQGVCSERPGLGAACDPDVTFQCGGGRTCWNGQCENRHALGEPCNDMHDCAEGFCHRTQKVCHDPFADRR